MFGYLWIMILAIVYLGCLVLSIKDIIDTYKCCRLLNIPIIAHLDIETDVFISFHIIAIIIFGSIFI